MDNAQTQEFVTKYWDETCLPALLDFVRIPNISPLFDANWATNGLQDQAVSLVEEWIKAQKVTGLTISKHTLKGRTPVLLAIIEVLCQPKGRAPAQEMFFSMVTLTSNLPCLHGAQAWIRINRSLMELYGRGAADDGYSAFAAIAVAKAVQAQSRPHPRLVLVLEASEESGKLLQTLLPLMPSSPDLPYYVESLADQIGVPDLAVCLDSGAGDYKSLWLTSSLRGMVVGNLTVKILETGVHSGHASGIVPSSFRIIRQLLNRIEDADTGEILIPEAYCKIPPQREVEAKLCAAALGEDVWEEFPWAQGAHPDKKTPNDQFLLNRTWRPFLAYTGLDDMPPCAQGGNVLRSQTTVKLSLRVPPLTDPQVARDALVEKLTKDPPYGACVTFHGEKCGRGWDAPPLSPVLRERLDTAASHFFAGPVQAIGEGGSIPFMGMLESGERFPNAQFLVLGVLGPQSNAHGPNEMLHLPTVRRLICTLAHVLADFKA